MLTTLNRRDQLVAEFSNSLAKRLVFSWKWYYITYVFRFWFLGRIHTLLSMISWEKCQEKLWVRDPFCGIWETFILTLHVRWWESVPVFLWLPDVFIFWICSLNPELLPLPLNQRQAKQNRELWHRYSAALKGLVSRPAERHNINDRPNQHSAFTSLHHHITKCRRV